MLEGRSRHHRLSTGLIVALVGCSSDEATAPDPRARFAPCGDYECASVEVPLDYAEPAGRKVSIALLRAPAKNPDARLGAVVVNPGGPGLAFVDRLAETYTTLSLGFYDATKRFDVVTFDWRGVGKSSALPCADDALFDRLRATDLTLKQPGASAAVASLRDDLVGHCIGASGDPALLARMNTENAARDLDRIREALGEEKLNYLGFSYGTWLGATYATLFPDRVRAFALDSATVLSGDLQADIREQARSYELGVGRLFEACARAADCKLAAPDAAGVAARFDAIVAKVEAGAIPAGARALSVVDLRFAISDALRSAELLPLAADLAAADAGDASALLARADVVVGRGADGRYDTSIVGLLAIACLDQPLAAGTTSAGFASFAGELRAEFPRGADSAILPWALCVEWPWTRSAPRVPIAAPSAPPVLVTSGRFDPITAWEQGDELVALLANGSHLVTYEADGHGAALRSECVRELVTAHLLDPSKAPASFSCAER